jgi:hypothetical protein
MTSQNVLKIGLFEHFFQVLSVYLEARVWVRIRIKGLRRIRIRSTGYQKAVCKSEMIPQFHTLFDFIPVQRERQTSAVSVHGMQLPGL